VGAVARAGVRPATRKTSPPLRELLGNSAQVADCLAGTAFEGMLDADPPA